MRKNPHVYFKNSLKMATQGDDFDAEQIQIDKKKSFSLLKEMSSVLKLHLIL